MGSAVGNQTDLSGGYKGMATTHESPKGEGGRSAVGIGGKRVGDGRGGALLSTKSSSPILVESVVP